MTRQNLFSHAPKRGGKMERRANVTMASCMFKAFFSLLLLPLSPCNHHKRSRKKEKKKIVRKRTTKAREKNKSKESKPLFRICCGKKRKLVMQVCKKYTSNHSSLLERHYTCKELKIKKVQGLCVLTYLRTMQNKKINLHQASLGLLKKEQLININKKQPQLPF